MIDLPVLDRSAALPLSLPTAIAHGLYVHIPFCFINVTTAISTALPGNRPNEWTDLSTAFSKKLTNGQMGQKERLYRPRPFSSVEEHRACFHSSKCRD